MEYNIGFFGVKSWEKEIIEKEITKLDSFGIGIIEGEVQDNIELAKKYDIISPFVYSKMDKKILDELPNLKMIATRSTGYDHIDVEGTFILMHLLVIDKVLCQIENCNSIA